MTELLPEGAKFLDMGIQENDSGQIMIAQHGEHVPFKIERVFVVQGKGAATERGNHAHRTCSQLMVCIAGTVEVALDDGQTQCLTTLESSAKGLLVPPLVWSHQRYLGEGSLLMVLCDEPYSADEYIREYQDFLDLRSSQ
jgi:dTDP-4-dehydrorhamnose 3,5-epimerase-like enzyme